MDYDERVKRGAALLDEKRPGWADEIDLDLLNLRSCTTCVLGQVFLDDAVDQLELDAETILDDDEDVYSVGCDLLDLREDTREQPNAKPHEDSPQFYGFNLMSPTGGDPRFAILQGLWVQEILARRETA